MTENQFAQLRAAIIEQENRRRPLILPASPHTRVENLPCYCKICDEMLDRLTNVHAEQHGFDDKYALIRAGEVSFCHAR